MEKVFREKNSADKEKMSTVTCFVETIDRWLWAVETDGLVVGRVKEAFHRNAWCNELLA